MSKPKYDDLVPIIQSMPPLSMWPDKSRPYADEDNQVVQWIKVNCAVTLSRAIKIRSAMASRKVLAYNPETKLWSGQTPV